MPLSIAPYSENFEGAIVGLSLRAWTPVFDKMQPAVQPFVYHAFYPNGWADRQANDIREFLRSEPQNVSMALDGDHLAGWVGMRLHPTDHMGEIYILAVDPDFQRRGVASALMRRAFATMKDVGMTMVMVETGGDPGHAASRATYETIGFERWSVARYFREL
jgi:GNAT superfamily N-acetyltransferase